MAKNASIGQIDSLEKQRHAEGRCPLYVMVAGGMGAGKSHVINAAVKTVDIFDIDDTMEELGFTSYTREQFSDAMEIISMKIKNQMYDNMSMVAMGTASVVMSAIDRLHVAKMMGYDTILVHIDAPIAQAVKQNRVRIENGHRGVAKADEHKIERTSIGAANTVATLRETALVDYFVYYNNTRNMDL